MLLVPLKVTAGLEELSYFVPFKNFFYIYISFLVALFWESLKPILATSTNILAFLSFYTAPGASVQAEMIEQHSWKYIFRLHIGIKFF